MKGNIGRNDPCPCGSGQKFKRCCMMELSPQASVASSSWIDRDGFHVVAPCLPPTQEQLEQMTKAYQKHIRTSPMWKEMVQEFGKEKAEELLKQCRVKPG
jgi:hypothetical protein